MPEKNDLMESALAGYRAINRQARWSTLRHRANLELGRRDSRQRWYHYRHGMRPIPMALQHWLLRWALHHALVRVARVRLADRFIEQMAPFLAPPAIR